MKDSFNIGIFMARQDPALAQQNGPWERAGTLHVVAGGGCAFAYTPTYNGPPLSPDLDYRKGKGQRTFQMDVAPNIRPAQRKDLFPVFAECLPGEWGERVLAGDKRFGLTFQLSSPAQRLFMLGNRRVGALYLQPEGLTEKEDCVPIVGEEALAQIERAAESYLASLSTSLGSDRERWCLTSNGGRQPKAVYRDPDGTEYLAKFTQEVDGSYELPRVEAAMLAASRAAGLDTADGLLRELGGNGRAAMLSKRFDREVAMVDDRAVVSYRHKVSMSTALGTEHGQVDYVDVAAWLRVNSSDPDRDIKDLFGRMALNAYANNTDDHPGNTEVMYDKDGRWRLAPNFDLLIDDSMVDGEPRRIHRMSMGGLDVPPHDMDFLMRVADDMGLEKEDALAIAARVLANIEALPDRLINANCSGATLERVVPALQLERVAALRATVDEALEKERERNRTEMSM